MGSGSSPKQPWHRRGFRSSNIVLLGDSSMDRSTIQTSLLGSASICHLGNSWWISTTQDTSESNYSLTFWPISISETTGTSGHQKASGHPKGPHDIWWYTWIHFLNPDIPWFQHSGSQSHCFPMLSTLGQPQGRRFPVRPGTEGNWQKPWSVPRGVESSNGFGDQTLALRLLKSNQCW